jgi:hypothetical protein
LELQRGKHGGGLIAGFLFWIWDLGWLKVWAVGDVVFGELKELAEV